MFSMEIPKEGNMERRNIQLFFLDVDGTVLNAYKKLAEAARKAVIFRN